MEKAQLYHLSDALFVVVTYLFATLLQNIDAQSDGKTYQGKIAPRNIGGRKDF